jgi:hypothetical protein
MRILHGDHATGWISDEFCFILARGMILHLFSEQSTPVARPLQPPSSTIHWVKRPVLEADLSGGPVKKSQSSVSNKPTV